MVAVASRSDPTVSCLKSVNSEALAYDTIGDLTLMANLQTFQVTQYDVVAIENKSMFIFNGVFPFGVIWNRPPPQIIVTTQYDSTTRPEPVD